MLGPYPSAVKSSVVSAYGRVGVFLYPPYLRAIHVVEDKILFTFKPGICEKCGSVVTTAVSTTKAQQAITRSVKGRTAPRRSNFQARSVTCLTAPSAFQLCVFLAILQLESLHR